MAIGTEERQYWQTEEVLEKIEECRAAMRQYRNEVRNGGAQGSEQSELLSQACAAAEAVAELVLKEDKNNAYSHAVMLDARKDAEKYMRDVLQADEESEPKAGRMCDFGSSAVNWAMHEKIKEISGEEISKWPRRKSSTDNLSVAIGQVASSNEVDNDTKEAALSLLDQIDSFESAWEMMDDIDKETNEMFRETDEFCGMLDDAQRYVDDMGMDGKMRAAIASENAQHPVKFAFGQLAAAVKAIGEIPRQISEERAIARAAELDAETALERAGAAVLRQAAGMKDASVASALAVSEKVGNVYKSAVDNLASLWQKSKASAAKGLASAVKGFDIGMEYITCGDWSRIQASKMYKVAKAESSFVPPSLSEKMSAFNLKLHDKLAGLSYSVESKEGGFEIEGNAYDYWHDVKSKANGNHLEGATVGKGDDVRQVEGQFGVVSPADVEMQRRAYQREKANEAIDKVQEAVRDAAGKTVDFAKGIPGRTKESAKKVAQVVQEAATEAASIAMESVTNVRVNTLRMASKTLSKAALVEKSSERRNQEKAARASSELLSSYDGQRKAHEKLGDIAANAPEARKFEFSQQEQDLRAAANAAIANGGPTATTIGYLKMMDKRERKGERKAATLSAIDKVAYNLRTAGVKLAQGLRLVDLKMSESMAQEDFDKAMDKVAKHGERGERLSSKAAELAEKADSLSKGDDAEREDEGMEMG